MNKLERNLTASLPDRIRERAEADLEATPVSAAIRLAGLEDGDFNAGVETAFLAKLQSRLG